jgi:Barstar (barnase inhibitor)
VVSPNPGLLAALLKTGRLGGVLRWKVVLSPETVTQECIAAGWRSVTLDTHGASSLNELLQISVSELGVELAAGNSLAAWDAALTGLMVQDVPLCITWVGWQDVIAKNPSDAEAIVSVFEDILKDQPGLVLIAGHQGSFPRVDELALA